MSDSILTSVKKVLGITEDYTAFDVDIVMHINSTFARLNSLGVGPALGFAIEDASATWDAFLGPDPNLNNVKSYVYQSVRLIFDPPATSFHTEALKQQIEKAEWLINVKREETEWVDPSPDPEVVWL